MMTRKYRAAALLLAIILLAPACKKNASGTYCNNCLPPATDTGANTFGCLVNGKVFLPQKRIGSMSIPLQCNYQNVDGSIGFTLGGTDFINNTSVGLAVSEIFIKGPSVFNYSIPIAGNAYASYDCCDNNSINPLYYTQIGSAGQLIFTRFDTLYQIASGTFWYDAVDTASRDTIHIRDGRFDVHFTR